MKTNSKGDSLEPPKEVPDLAMEQFPLEEDNIPTGRKDEVKFEEFAASPAILPHLEDLDIKKFNDKKTDVQMSAAIQSSKPMPVLDPIILTPQNPQVSKEIISQKLNPENTNITNELSIKNDSPGLKDDDLMTNDANKIIIKKTIPPPSQYFGKEEDEDEKRRETFFSKLKEKLENQGGEKIRIDPKQIIQNMKEYQNNIMEKEKALKEKQSLDARLADKIMTLELLEDGWYMLRKEIETKQILLLEKEKLIDSQVFELKQLMEKEKRIDKRMIPQDKWFILRDGRRISSLEDLKETLKNVENHIFYHHVNETRNDFSSWVRHVFENTNLADRIIYAKTREELIDILENN